MKFISTLSITLMSIVTLAGCASSTGGTMAIDPNAAIGTATNIGTTVFQTTVNQKCQSEITSNQYYKLASVAMSSEQQTNLVNNVCSCVAQKGPQSVTLTDMATAAIDSKARGQIVTKAVSNTMQACVSEFVK